MIRTSRLTRGAVIVKAMIGTQSTTPRASLVGSPGVTTLGLQFARPASVAGRVDRILIRINTSANTFRAFSAFSAGGNAYTIRDRALVTSVATSSGALVQNLPIGSSDVDSLPGLRVEPGDLIGFQWLSTASLGGVEPGTNDTPSTFRAILTTTNSAVPGSTYTFDTATTGGPFALGAYAS